ncbi:hypothetical protein X740_06125 [Mesorhizobium sp. LNHC221B00]|nr:hypothetical protein X740_06125 [Mesorhizobium sp. LNHC221B00]
MPNVLTLLRVLAPISILISAIATIALSPHSAMFAFWLALPLNAAGWPALRMAERTTVS